MKNLFLFIFLFFQITKVLPQSQDVNAEFYETRKTDFTKLLGIQTSFEGIKINYNTDKASIEGNLGKSFGKGKFLVQVGGALGTTTNLNGIFDQKVLPATSVNISLSRLLPKSIWRYDASLPNNYSAIQGNGAIGNIITGAPFRYTEAFREKVNSGKHPSNKTLYTFKRLLWATATLKYDNNKYSFYNSARNFSKQLYDTAYQTFSGRVNVNGYVFWNKEDAKWASWRPNFLFLTAYLNYGRVNNISQLKKINVTDISSSVLNNNTERQISKTSSSYTGEYKEYRAVTPGFEFIFAPIKTVSLDLFGEYNYFQGTAQISNYGSYGTGIFFYTSSGNISSKLNIGVFYKRVESSNNNWEGQFGLKTSIPITPL
ncbi:hypothetical protein [Desertivirga arenae]|uniref:hypothetical protein n=1 Tax=Desertivirga arenae TaxID=2810309 RepID=UPI001A97B18D|nr:hypothetical protein [Pedobacter sp. SYSU D00823]